MKRGGNATWDRLSAVRGLALGLTIFCFMAILPITLVMENRTAKADTRTLMEKEDAYASSFGRFADSFGALGLDGMLGDIRLNTAANRYLAVVANDGLTCTVDHTRKDRGAMGKGEGVDCRVTTLPRRGSRNEAEMRVYMLLSAEALYMDKYGKYSANVLDLDFHPKAGVGSSVEADTTGVGVTVRSSSGNMLSWVCVGREEKPDEPSSVECWRNW